MFLCAEFIQDLCEHIRELGMELHVFSGGRVYEAERSRVQQLTSHLDALYLS